MREVVVEGNTRTRAEVIRRELLFSPGDTLSSELLEETARNLRALLFLGNVRVETVGDGDSVDVTVRVRDLYARAITPLLSGKPGELSYGAVGLDYNLLGRGQILEVTGEHDAIEGNRARIFYRVPRVAGSHVRVDADVEAAEEGHHAIFSIVRPFYRLSERWSASASVFDLESVDRLYRGDVVSEKYVSRERGGSLAMRRSSGERVKVRPGVFLTVSDRAFSPEPGFAYAPADRRRVLSSVGVTVWRPRYETTTFLRRLGRTEDVQTGSWVTARVGASVEAVGSDRDYRFVTVDVNPRFKPSPSTYLFARLTSRMRFSQGRVWNVFASAEATIVHQVRAIHALAARVRWDGLGRTEDAAQFLLGSARGLRGYALRRFDGSRRMTVNLEARPTLLRKRTYTAAAVVFVDGGAAWTPGAGDRLFSVGAGAGGRLGLNRVYNAPVLRADLGYGFRDRTWVLYVGLAQYFQ